MRENLDQETIIKAIILFEKNILKQMSPYERPEDEKQNLDYIAAIRGFIAQLADNAINFLPKEVHLFAQRLERGMVYKIPKREDLSIRKMRVTDTDVTGKLFMVALKCGIINGGNDMEENIRMRNTFHDREIIEIQANNKNYFYDAETGKFLLSGPPYPSFL